MRYLLPFLVLSLTLLARDAQAQADDDHRRHLFNHHADPTAQITSQNVGKMPRAWTIETKHHVSHRPLVENGRVFFADWSGTVYAADVGSGRVLWKNTIENPKTTWPWYGFAGTGALGEGRLYEASTEGNAFALDQATGEVLWQTRIAEDPEGGSISKNLYYDGLVYIGLSSVEEMLSMNPGFEVNFRGKVLALDAATGDLVWERQLVHAPHNGVSMWSSFAVDPETSTLYFTTSNNYTGEASELSDAIVAVDAKTGETKWHRQVYEHDTWTMAEPYGPDYAFAAGPQLFEAGERKLVGAGNKSGVYFVWDRTTGEPVWNHAVGYGSVGGGIHGEPSIGNGRIFIWGNNAYAYKNPAQHPMDITAVEAATGKAIWTNPKAQPAVEVSAGFLANDVYFVGSLDGQVRAYHAGDGKLLWRSGEYGSVASSLTVDGGMLMWGSGVPASYGGEEGESGVVAYRMEPQAQALAPSKPEPEKEKGCAQIICAPTVTFQPSFFLLPLGESARTASVRIESGEQVIGDASEGVTNTEFGVILNVGAPTGIPRVSVFTEMIWYPFLEGPQNPFTEYAVGGEQLEETVNLNMPSLGFGLSVTALPMKVTNGWLGLAFNVLDQFGPAAQPDDEGAYTHKLNLETEAVLGIFQWLPKENPLRKVNAFATLAYTATGLPEEGDIVPAASPGDPGTIYLEDGNAWVLNFGLVIPIMPLELNL